MSTVQSYTQSAIDTLITQAKARGNHTGSQTASTISDLTEVVQDLIGSTIVAGTNVTVNYNDTAGTFTINSTASGGGGSTSTEGVLLSAYTNGLGTAAANTTGIQNWINAAKTAKKPAINDLGGIDVNISSVIDMVGDHLIVRGNGLRLVQTVNTAAGIRVGAEAQFIDSLVIYFSGNPTSTNTAANGVEFANPLCSVFQNIVIQNGARGLYLPQAVPANGDQSSNTVFSCVFNNIRISGYAIGAIEMQTYPHGGAASTGSAWINVYIHNNWFGSNGTPSSWPVTFRNFDEGVFNQFNVEWSNPPSDAIFLQECQGMTFNSLHFEGIQLTGNSALFRTYYATRAEVHTLMVKNITIANNTGQKSIFRGYTADGNPGGVDVTNVRVDSTQNAGSKPFGLCEIESGSTNLDFIFRRVDLTEFNGSVIVDPTGFVPAQVEAYNDVRLRSQVGPNIPVDKVRTTAATAITNATLVSDTTLTFPTTVGTYVVEGVHIFTAPAAADLALRFNCTGTATGKFALSSASTAGTAMPATADFTAVPINTTKTIGGVDSVEQALYYHGTLIVTAAGVFTIQYAEAVASGSLLPAAALSRLSYRKIS